MRKYSFVLSVAAIVLVFDQVTKWYIRRTVGLYESIVVLDSFFHITHVRNAGGAFSLFAGAAVPEAAAPPEVSAPGVMAGALAVPVEPDTGTEAPAMVISWTYGTLSLTSITPF